MNRIRITLVGIIGAFTVLWLLADGTLWSSPDFQATRDALLQLTGVLAIGTMSVAMVLAMRSPRIDPFLGGLDKAYRLHKWMGITGLIFAFLHFLAANILPMLAGGDEVGEATVESTPASDSAVHGFFIEQEWLAAEFGDWGFKFAAVLIAIALIRRFPYRFFFVSHRFLAAVFIFLALHSVALMKFDYWNYVIGWASLALMSIGTVAAAVSLLGLIGVSRRAVGEVERLELSESNSILKVGIRMKSRWAGHKEGQFAFVTFDKREGAHPFTIASPWTGDGEIAFFIKDLGDYTATLPATINRGDLATVEGPYGCFEFDRTRPRQVWIAGGIGIAPFVARIKALMNSPSENQVDFFYSASRTDDQRFLDRVREASEAANVNLHLIRPEVDSLLDAERILEDVPDWKEAEFLFCGPTQFGEEIENQLVQYGLPSHVFHRELFDMR